ncbi:hypothetical protein HZH66_014285 [Vespula vulgaris]|uniref:Uncharacterized protein n=1 Tax=Vespula vulgaris TaxID=7454 RepID=A0A834J5Q4_VESVU|nr:hypothetical protein HZH66_014285 [Vespula vulgaris]
MFINEKPLSDPIKPLKPARTINENLAKIMALKGFVRNLKSVYQFRYVDYIGQFTIDIRHISGKENITADTFNLQSLRSKEMIENRKSFL